MKYIEAFFNGMADPNGRTSRNDFWMTTFALMIFNFIVSLAFVLIGNIISSPTLYQFVTTGLSLVILISTISMQIRRLHDVGKPGTYIFFNLIPVVGQIILFIYYIKPGDIYENNYGLPRSL